MGYYASVVLADKPIQYYRLGEAGGTVAYDQSSNHRDGTLHGGITPGQPGLLQGDSATSMLFNGFSGYISNTANGLAGSGAPFSLECWVKPTSLAHAGTFLQMQDAFFFMGGDGHLGEYSGGSNHTTSAVTLVAGGTYYCCLTYNGSAIAITINDAPATLVETSVTPVINPTGLLIGTDVFNEYFIGYLQEPAIYTAALSATQIKNHYLAGIGAINFPVVPITALTRDGHVTVTARDGVALTTKTRG